ncbi:hypothetical protein ACHAXR_011268 [Thalassiosira sp. AJA248-18]
MASIRLMFVWAGLALPPCSTFQLPRHPNFCLTQSPSGYFHGHLQHHLDASGSADNDRVLDSNDEDDEMPAPAQDLRLFVTQRCIQSFMFLLASTRDLHTVWWLDDVVQPITVNNYWDEDDDYKPGSGDTFRANDKGLGSKLLNYHGLSALNTTMFPEWDSFFTSLLEEPDSVLRIKTPKEVGRRVYSEIDIDVEPARLCARILSVREQISREMAGDLKAIANMGQQIFSSYWKNAKERKDTKKAKGSGTAYNKEESSPYAFDRPSTMYINFDPNEDDPFAPSPLRKGNFDLLYNLVTQSAVVELLKSDDGVVVGEEVIQNKASQLFLSKFYQERLLTHFIGSQFYGKGDDFIQELMLGSPILMPREGSLEGSDEESDDSKVSSNPPLEVEPMRIAEQILLKRDKLALEWVEHLQAVPTEHTDIRKMQLERLTAVPEAAPVETIVDDEFQ